MSLGMLIIMIIKEQFTYDNFHKDSDQIYRVNTILLNPEWGRVDFASAPLPLAQVLMDEYSFSEDVVRVSRQLFGDATYQNVNVPVKGLLVDPSFLEVFNFPFSTGDPSIALVAPNSLVLTRQAAVKIFGQTEPVGKTISLGKFGEFTVTGVLQEFAGKTHFDFEMVCSISTLPALEKNSVLTPVQDNWSAYHNNYIYFKLRDGYSTEVVERALADISKKFGVGLKAEGRDVSYEFYLHPLEKITPGPELSSQMGTGLPSFVLIFFGVLAGVVLLMSVFNFTNLTIARSLSRAREIGIRKVVGAKRHQVFFQFIGEAVIFSLIALSLSYVLLQFLKDGFLQLSLNEDFFLDLNEDFSLYAIFVVFAIGVGMLAGLLPAAYLSAFKPSRVLKDIQNLKVYARLTFRKILMVVQFTLSIVFVIVVLVIYRQVDFMLTFDYGIEQKNNLNLTLRGITFEKIAHEIRNVPGVTRVGGVSHKLGTWANGSSDYKKNLNDKALVIHHFMVDDNYIENLSLKFLAGQNFDALEQSEREKDVILNETALDQLGFQHPADAIGQTIYAADTLELKIIGVVKDFHFRPLNNKIGPLALRYNMEGLNYANIKINPSQKESVIASIKGIWKKHDPIHSIDFMMMEEEIDDAYRQAGMKDVVVMVGYITFLVISLACLGMLGMAMYASQIRAKEVGVRKVMGASVVNVMLLLSKSFMTLISIAVVIGVPVSFLLGELFLEGFAYKIQITPFLLIIGVAVIVGLGLVIVWSQTIKVAFQNPVKWLRHE